MKFSFILFSLFILYDKQMGKELETTSKGVDIEKQVQAKESKVQERSIVLAGELEAENSKEDAMSTKMPKQEVN